MRLTKRQLLTLIYEQQVADSKTPDEVEPEEDAWAGGDNLEDPIDWQDEATDVPSDDTGPEVLKIVEKLKRRMQIKKIMNENLRKR